MGLEPIQGFEGAGGNAAGIFALPPGFDTKQFAAKWVEQPQVPWAKQRESLMGTNLTADGWEVWKSGEEGSRAKPTTATDGKGRTYVLLCRPAQLQKQVNAAYGNVSKQHINREVRGETVQGSQKQDAGILTERQLGGENSPLAAESELTLNEVGGGGPSATVAT